MAFQRGPNIVTNGLVLALDAANPKSYVSGSTTWRDVSGNGNSGSLVNGPTFLNNSIVLDGVNDYVIVDNLSGSYFPQSEGTISFWYYIPSNNGSTDFTDIGIFDGYDPSRNHFFIRNYYIQPDNLQVCAHANDGTQFGIYRFAYTTYVPNDYWHNIILCYKTGIASNIRLFIDGILKINTSLSSTTFVPDGQIVGFTRGAAAGYTGKSGRYSNLNIYNRTLSEQEVLQNYNAQKSRFNL